MAIEQAPRQLHRHGQQAGVDMSPTQNNLRSCHNCQSRLSLVLVMSRLWLEAVKKQGQDLRVFWSSCLKVSWQSMTESRILQMLEQISMKKATRKKLTMNLMTIKVKAIPKQ
jgi:hypothetical protein